MARTKHLVFTGKKPPKNFFIMFLLMLEWIFLIPGVKQIIRTHLKHSTNIDFLPGFKYYYGNIYATNVHFGNAFILDYAPVHVGKNTSFGWDCMVLTAHHEPNNWDTVHAKSVHIGKQVTIYSRTIILGGVSIGDSSVIGAGSVVTKDIPAGVFAAGNPAKVIKQLL